MILNRRKVEMLKEAYPAGTKVMVDYMEDIHAIPSGSIGTVCLVDDIGQIHLNEWGLALVPDVDKFHIVREE